MNFYADPKRHISEGFLTTAEINRFGTLETAESVNGVGLSDISAGSNYSFPLLPPRSASFKPQRRRSA